MNDAFWMQQAIAQAKLGIGKTAPNPPVGAVIVKGNQCLGQGYHHKAGLPHAEREAIADAIQHHGKESLIGATAYVTLEPCSTHGRTPPCTDGLIEAGVRRVVYAVQDANPSHAGAADIILQSAGIEVIHGVCAEDALALVAPFFKKQREGLPWILWKVAMSWDGKITRPLGESQWLSCSESLDEVQRLRSEVDAIFTSGETVRRDLPALTIRRPELLKGRSQPQSVIFTHHADSLPRNAPLFDPENRTIIPLVKENQALKEIVKGLALEYGWLSIMLECGGKLAQSFLNEGLIDEIALFQCPILCGDSCTPGFLGNDGSSFTFEKLTSRPSGIDTYHRGLLKKT